jgi:hypothetical protein
MELTEFNRRALVPFAISGSTGVHLRFHFKRNQLLFGELARLALPLGRGFIQQDVHELALRN